MEAQYIGIDMGGTNIRLALVSKEGEVGDLVFLSTKEYSSWGDLLIKLTSMIAEMDRDRVKAVGVAVAGGVLIPKGIMSYSPNVRWMDGQPVRENLAKATGLPVWIENDANAITYGEWMYGAGKGFSSIICLTLGSGVGGSALSAIYGERSQKREIDDQLNPVQIYERAIGGEKLALDVFDTFGEHLGIAIANLVNVFSVHHYIITGGVSHAWELFSDPLERALEANLFSPHRRRVEVFPGQLGDKAGVMGVARLAADYL